VVLVVFIFAPEIVSGLFGEGFAPAILAMRILLVFISVAVAADVFYSLAAALEFPELLLSVSLWGVVNLGLNMILIPQLGIYGAALGTGATSLGIYAHFRKVFADKGFNFTYPWSDFLKIQLSLLPLLIMCVTAHLVFESLMVKMIVIALGAIIYLTGVRKYSPFSIEEKSFIQRNTGSWVMVIIK